MALTCAHCGEGTIRPLARSGRRLRYRQIPDLELPATLELSACDHCGESWLSPDELEQVDAALEEEYRRELCRRTERAVERLKGAGMAQRDLERLIGVSAGLLSKIKGGKETSPTLTALLMLLANGPERPAELEQLWRRVHEEPEVVMQVSSAAAPPSMFSYPRSTEEVAGPRGTDEARRKSPGDWNRYLAA